MSLRRSLVVAGLASVAGGCQWPRPGNIDADAGADAMQVDARAPILAASHLAADLVLGQPDFTSTADRGCTARSTSAGGVGFDGATLWVGDSMRARVLGWAVADLASVDAPATRVAGHRSLDDCTKVGGGVSGEVLSHGVAAFGTAQVLFVADSAHNRVLGWSPPPTAGGMASVLVGQLTYAGAGNDDGGARFFGPSDGWSDGNQLVVADTFNHRVLIWNNFPTSLDDTADVVLGRETFDAPLGTLSGSTMTYPMGVWYDGARLYVAAAIDHRVMIWNTMPTVNNQPADVFVGQPSGLANQPGAGAAGLTEPRDVTVHNGALFVADYGNDRVMVWDPVPTTNGVAASFVLGQPDFDTVVVDAPATAQSLSDPTSVVGAGAALFVGDRGHQRVLRFPLGR